MMLGNPRSALAERWPMKLENCKILKNYNGRFKG